MNQVSVVFQLLGGPLNGEVHRSGEDAAGPNKADVYWCLTQGGEIGRGFVGLAPLPDFLERGRKRSSWAYRYEVIDRAETAAEIIVTCKFVSAPSPA